MRKPNLYVLLRKADGISVTQRLTRVEGYTNKVEGGEDVLGFAGYYTLSWRDKRILHKNEQYVFFTEDYRFEIIDGKRCVGQKEGSVGAVPIMPDKSGAPGENYAVLLRTHAYADGYRTMKGDVKLPLMWIVIIVLLIVVVIGGLYYYRSISAEVVPGESTPGIEEGIEEGIKPLESE
jgi:hypothetical protein